VKFREIITLTDDFRVAQGKATIAVYTVAWCNQVENFINRMRR
jgi:hypothetical protein